MPVKVFLVAVAVSFLLTYCPAAGVAAAPPRQGVIEPQDPQAPKQEPEEPWPLIGEERAQLELCGGDPDEGFERRAFLCGAVAGFDEGFAGGKSWMGPYCDHQEECLQGIETIGVDVQGLDDVAQRAGLTTSQLTTDIELKLRLAGIPVADNASLSAKRSSVDLLQPPVFLHVSLDLLKVTLKDQSVVGYSGAISVSVVTFVEIPLNELSTTAKIWSMESLAFASPSQVDKHFRGAIKDLVDRFILDYLRANTKN